MGLGRDWDFRANAYVPVGTRAYAFAPESTAALSGAAVHVTTTTREERALQGFDAEAGWRAPIFDSEASRQLRLYVGGYRFSHAGTLVEGPRLRIPLGKEGASARTLTAQERRMTVPVMRDVDIVTQNRVASTLVEAAPAEPAGKT